MYCNAARTCRLHQPTARETIMAQTARNEAEKATDNVAELGKRTADKGAGPQGGLTRSPPRRSFELDERHGRALGSGRARFKRPCDLREEPAVANPWTKKNPILSLWLSGANAVAGKARSAGTAEAKR